MVLIKSISGERGTIDKNDVSGLSSSNIKDSVEQYIFWIKNEYNFEKNSICIRKRWKKFG